MKVIKQIKERTRDKIIFLMVDKLVELQPNTMRKNLGSVEEPPTFTLAERDANWRQAMLEEMKVIEENETWQLVDHLQDAV